MPGIRRRRPLLRAAGAAAVGRAMYRAGERRGEQEQEQEQSPSTYPPPGPARPGLSEEAVSGLTELGRLHEQGILTDEEFERQKQRYLQES
jgi:Short C-terminal domain